MVGAVSFGTASVSFVTASVGMAEWLFVFFGFVLSSTGDSVGFTARIGDVESGAGSVRVSIGFLRIRFSLLFWAPRRLFQIVDFTESGIGLSALFFGSLASGVFLRAFLSRD